MVRDEAVAVVQERLGFRTDLATNIVSNMQLAQQELEQGLDLPWFLRKFDATLVNTAGNLDLVTLPTDFLEVDDDEERPGLWYLSDSTWVPLYPAEAGAQRQDAYASQYAAFTHYSILGYNIFLGPIAPTVVTTFRLHYYGKGTLLDSNIENAWLKEAPEVLINAAGVKIAAALRDKEAIEVFSGLGKAASAALMKANAVRAPAPGVMAFGG